MAEFKSISLSEQDHADIDAERKRLIQEGYKRTGVMPKLSMAETINIMKVFYLQRKKLEQGSETQR